MSANIELGEKFNENQRLIPQQQSGHFCGRIVNSCSNINPNIRSSILKTVAVLSPFLVGGLMWYCGDQYHIESLSTAGKVTVIGSAFCESLACAYLAGSHIREKKIFVNNFEV